MALKKVRLALIEMAPDLGQFKPFGIRLGPPRGGEVLVEFQIPDKEVVHQTPETTVLTPEGMAAIAVIMAKYSWLNLKFIKQQLGGKN